MSKHTPWRVAVLNNNCDFCEIVDSRDTPVIMEAIDNDAEYIVRCVNAHDELVAALESLTLQAELETWPNTPTERPAEVIAARAILKEVKS